MMNPTTMPRAISGEASGRVEVPPGRTVLIIDDAPEIRMLLKHLVASWGHRVLVASSGLEGLELVAEHGETLDAILCDVMMPGMDGFQVTRRIRQMIGGAWVPIVLVTAKDELGDVVTGFEAGADDYVTKPIRFPELKARLRSALINSWMHRTLREHATEMRRDLEAARELQVACVPQGPRRLADVDAAWIFRPSSFVGGDMLNFFETPDGEVIFYVADVSGHGVAAAMLSIWLSETVRGKADASNLPLTDPAAMCAVLDGMMEQSAHDRYVTLFYGVYRPDTRELAYCRAGHPCAVLTDPTGAQHLLDVGGPPVGMGLPLPYETGRTTVAAGSSLLVYTDGITEVVDPGGAQLGPEFVERSLVQHAGETPEAIVGSLYRDALSLAATDFDDDCTIMALQFAARSAANSNVLP